MTATATPDLAPWPPTRDEALRRLTAFVPHAGRDYAAKRNYDFGPGRHGNVSQLSPYIRARVITEEDVLRAVLARFSPESAEKFVSEVFWRTYWKGWLEARPAVWRDYLAAIPERREAIDRVAVRRKQLAAAEAGGTGIEPFDAWVRELVETGYVHNHARMWFASIWIFTLDLPWELGADLFMRHLRCGDPASNTLSWRWVAGLHTRGKSYLALPSNIDRYTEGRFNPAGELSRRAEALDGPSYPLERKAAVPQVALTGPAVLVLHDDDTGVESLPLGDADIRATLGFVSAGKRSPGAMADGALDFARGAVADGISRAPHGTGGTPLDGTDVAATAEAIAARAAEAGVTLAIAPFAPVGPVRDTLDALREPLAARGVTLREAGRRYDALAYPHATRGFFALREKIPQVLAGLDVRKD